MDSVTDCLKRLVSEMIYTVSSETATTTTTIIMLLNFKTVTHFATHDVAEAVFKILNFCDVLDTEMLTSLPLVTW